MSRKVYEGAAVDVSFDPEVCEHSGVCVKNLPDVFDVNRRPWITPDGDEAARVVEVVAICPSGALRIERDDSGAGSR